MAVEDHRVATRRLPIVGAVVCALVGGGVAAGRADPVHEPLKVELPAVAGGTFDPPDPPILPGADPSVGTLAVPEAHPWMLFSPGDELDGLRERVRRADASSVVGRAWAAMRARADACCSGRASFEDGLADLDARTYGRDDLAELGLVWHLTGDDAYLNKARALLQYVVATAPDHGAPREPGVDEFYIQRAHRLNGFALAYDLLHPGLPPEDRAGLLGVIAALGAQQAAHARTAWWGTVSAGSNIGAVNGAALATAGLALWHELPAAREWVVRGEQIVRGYFLDGFDSDGAGIEGVLYGNYGMRVPTILNHALIRAGHTSGSGPGLDHVGGIDRHQEWVAYEVLPGGGAVNPINDARYYELNPSFTSWSSTYGDTPALSRWILHEVVRKHPGGSVGDPISTVLWYTEPNGAFDPASMLPLARQFAGRGLVHVRSGWRAHDLMAAFEARQNDWGEAVHQNQDVNSFVLYANGARLVVDSRYANWLAKTAAGDAEAARTSETQAHNYLVADGRSQDFHGKGDLQTFVSTASAVGETGGLDIAVGDARKAYITDQPRRAERVFVHVRADAAAGTPGYLIVADRFQQDEAEHDHTWYLHTDWTNAMRVVAPNQVRVDAPNGSGLTMTMHASRPFGAEVGSFTPDDAQDWRYFGKALEGRKTQPRLEITSRGTAFESISVLVPTAPGAPTPAVSPLKAEGGIALAVDHGGVVDLVLLATDDAERTSTDRYSTDAMFAIVRHDRAGAAIQHGLVDGQSFDEDGRPLVAFDAPVAATVSNARVTRSAP